MSMFYWKIIDKRVYLLLISNSNGLFKVISYLQKSTNTKIIPFSSSIHNLHILYNSNWNLGQFPYISCTNLEARRRKLFLDRCTQDSYQWNCDRLRGTAYTRPVRSRQNLPSCYLAVVVWTYNHSLRILNRDLWTLCLCHGISYSPEAGSPP